MKNIIHTYFDTSSKGRVPPLYDVVIVLYPYTFSIIERKWAFTIINLVDYQIIMVSI